MKLNDLAAGIVAEVKAVGRSYQRGLEHARKAGEYLSEARRLVDEAGESFEQWVRKNLRGVLSYSTAWRYMSVYQNWDRLSAKDRQGKSVSGMLKMFRDKAERRGRPRKAVKVFTSADVAKAADVYGLAVKTLVAILGEFGVSVQPADLRVAA